MSDDTTLPTGASKHDKAKPDLSLLPKIFLEEVAKAFMVGEKKYGRYNYTKGHKASQLVAAAQRHITAWYQGEENDPVDGQHHLGAAAACMAMALRQAELGTLKDDRFKAAMEQTEPAIEFVGSALGLPKHACKCDILRIPWTTSGSDGIRCVSCGGMR